MRVDGRRGCSLRKVHVSTAGRVRCLRVATGSGSRQSSTTKQDTHRIKGAAEQPKNVPEPRLAQSLSRFFVTAACPEDFEDERVFHGGSFVDGSTTLGALLLLDDSCAATASGPHRRRQSGDGQRSEPRLVHRLPRFGFAGGKRRKRRGAALGGKRKWDSRYFGDAGGGSRATRS